MKRNINANIARNTAAPQGAIALDGTGGIARRVAAALLAAIIALALCFTVPLRALADEPYIYDTRVLYNQSQYAELESQAAALSDQYGVGVYLLTVSNIGSKSARTYAINFYREQNLGLGSDKSGILFLIAADSRDYVTITYGDGINAFTDWQISNMEDDITDELHNDNWYDAAKAYLDGAETALSFRAERGEPLDSDNAPTSPFILVIFVAVAVALAAGIAGWRCYVLYRRMKTARPASNAADYANRETFMLQEQNDWYVTSSVVATPKAQSSSSGGGGGSSIGSGGFGGSSGGKF